MKKTILISALFMVTFSLAACGNVAVTDLDTASGNGQESFSEKLINQNSNVDSFKSLPTWALDIGLRDYEEFTVDQKNSSIVEADGVMPDSFDVIYTGDIFLLLEAGRNLVNQYSMAVTLDDLENSILLAEGKTSDGRYNISVYIDGKTFELSAVDLEQVDEFNR